MERPIPSRRLPSLLSTTAIALCLTLALPVAPGFDLPAKPAFAKGGEGGESGEGGEGGKGGESDRGGGEGGEGGGDDGGDGGEGGEGGGDDGGGGEGGEGGGDDGGGGGEGGEGGGDDGRDGGEGGEGGNDGRGAGEGGDDDDGAAGEAAEAEAAGENDPQFELEKGDGGDRRDFGLESLSSLSTTTSANRLLWIAPPKEPAVTTTALPGDPGKVIWGPPQDVAPEEGPSKVVGVPVPLGAVAAVPPKLAPKPASRPLAVKLAPLPAAKPTGAEAAALSAPAQGAEAGTESEVDAGGLLRPESPGKAAPGLGEKIRRAFAQAIGWRAPLRSDAEEEGS